MSYWTFPDGSVEGEETCVLSPDDVMGGVVCAEVREAKSRTSEKPAVKRQINRTCSPYAVFTGENLLLLASNTDCWMMLDEACQFLHRSVGRSILGVRCKRNNRANGG